MQYPSCIMVIGNGGRECAIASACLKSPRLERLIITPANWGVVDPHGDRVTTLAIKPDVIHDLTAAIHAHKVDLVIVGPEDPLCAGLADHLRSEGINVVGPGKAAAKLEGSKSFAKAFMERHNIPTASAAEFTDAEELLAHIGGIDGPVVLKADGLAAGKGVIVCQDRTEAEAAARRIAVDREFGKAGNRVLVEECLTGPEISWTCLVSGGKAELLGVSTDYKPLKDGNQGPNTGGMGNMCPTPYATEEVTAEFHERILKPIVKGLAVDRLDYRGFLFIGTMLTADGLKVLEFNVRLGDPEAQVVLPMNDADWPAVFAGVAAGQWSEQPKMRDGACVAVVLASGNYPYGKSEPQPINGLSRLVDRGIVVGADPPVAVYFAGVSREGGPDGGGYRSYIDNSESTYLASGGRVLAVSARAADLSEARRLAYEAVGNLNFEGMQFRTDIARLG